MSFLSKRPYLLALLLSGALVGWMMSRPATSESPVPVLQATESPARTILSVQVQEKKAESLPQRLIISGQTAASRSVTLRAELDAKVIAIEAKRGSRINSGDVIMRLEMNALEAQLQEVQALIRQRELEYKGAENLSGKGFQSKTQLSQAKAALDSARAALKQVKISIENTVIRAPFDGILVSRPLELGDYVGVGDTVAEIMDDDPMLVTGEVSERQRPKLTIGDSVEVHLVTGENLTGKLSLISARAKAATRTFDIEAEIPNPDGHLAAGITSEISMSLGTQNAHHIPASLLSLNDEGVPGVKTVDDDNRVHFFPAQFVRTDASGMWLTGLPTKVRLITVGQGFVRTGDMVKPVPASDNNTRNQEDHS